MVDLVERTRAERLALIDYLETLTPAQWETPSLCEGWRVQDVAAHLAWASVMPPQRMLTELVRARLSVNRLIADTARRDAGNGPQAILKQLRTVATKGSKPAGMPQIAALGDALVHELDIRRPLGTSRAIDGESFRPAAEFFAKSSPVTSLVLGGSVQKRLDGLRLVATDQDWTKGQGAEVRASGATLLLALAGRRVERATLEGPGADTLATRLGLTV